MVVLSNNILLTAELFIVLEVKPWFWAYSFISFYNVPKTRQIAKIMSWSMNIIGKPDDVMAVVDKDQHLPEPLKAAVRIFAKAGENTSTGQNYGAMRVQTHGHFSTSDAWSSCTFTIERLSMAPPAPVPSGG